MKLFLLLLAVVSIFGCNSNSSNENYSNIYGKWEVDSLQLSFENIKTNLTNSEIQQIKEEANISSVGSTFEFTNDGKFTVYPSDAMRKMYDSKPEEAKYRVEKNEIIGIQNGVEDKNRTTIISNSQNSMCLFVKLPPNKLTEQSGLQGMKLYLSKLK